MLLHPHFKLIGIKPGKVIVPGFGAVDFSLPVSYDRLLKLWELKIPYLALTREGKKALVPTVKSKKTGK